MEVETCKRYLLEYTVLTWQEWKREICENVQAPSQAWYQRKVVRIEVSMFFFSSDTAISNRWANHNPQSIIVISHVLTKYVYLFVAGNEVRSIFDKSTGILSTIILIIV